MDLPQMTGLLVQNLRNTGLPEVFAVITGLLSVWYARKENILVYPVGIVSVLIYVYLCYHAGLYADMGINAFYFVMSLYGWYIWTRRDKVSHEVRPVAWAGFRLNLAGILAVVIFSFVLYWILSCYTDSTVPVLDSFTTSIFITGMWFMALKKIENWIYWIIGDIICIFLFPYKGLVFSGLQYLVFLILAVAGLVEWIRKERKLTL
ncbi:MAG: nicotinamide riboside transporter PnuC [Bacteroidetes bacterium]|nr:nicotinamide riboside transporter PnuC [Bacteroidota bacterium]